MNQRIRNIFTRGLYGAICWAGAYAAAGQTIVGPGDIRPVTTSTDTNYILNGGTLVPTAVTLSGSIELQSSSTIIRPKNPVIVDRGGSFETSLGSTNLIGPIGGPGDLKIFNHSRDQFFVKGNNDFSGHTYIGSGQVFATTPTAFGSASSGTTIQGGFVIVQAPTEEPFRVEGGALRFDAGEFVPAVPVTIAGGEVILPRRDKHTMPAVVDGPGGTLTFNSGSTSSWIGGSVGTGTLGLAGRINVDAPLDHQGGLVILGAQLNVANTFSGDTTIRGDAVINHPDAFGMATSPIVMESGSLKLNVIPNGNRPLVVKRGELDVASTTPINFPVTLGGTFAVDVVSNGAFNEPIDYVTTPGGGIVHLRKGTFNGAIRGTTEIRLGSIVGDVVLNAANEMRSRATVVDGRVIVNHPLAVSLASTQIERGVVELNVPATQSPLLTGYRFDNNAVGTLRLNADQAIDDTWIVNEGVLDVAADVQLQRLLLLGVNGLASIKTSNGGSLQIDEEILSLCTGEVRGVISGSGDIRTVGSSLYVDADLRNWDGDLIVERGTLRFGASTKFGDGTIHVYDEGELYLPAAGVIENDISLHGPSEVRDRFSSSLIGNDATLRGKLDIGTAGARIRTGVQIVGPIVGKDLTFEFGGSRILSPQTQLQGVVQVDNETGLSLLEEGQLHGVDSILLNKGAVLGIAPVLGGPQDRIGDDIEIKSRGGRISNISISYDNRTTTERLGKLNLISGLTEIYAYYDSGAPNQSLKFASLEREQGAILRFSLHASAGGAGFVERPALEHGMIGPWAITDNGFATLDANGAFQTLAATSNNLGTAGPTDHVAFGGSYTLTRDTTIASLQINPTGDPQDFNLGGHQLKILSGGVFRASPEIRNGTLTAGDGEDAELVLHHTSKVSADIVDNSASGSVSLVIGNNPFPVRLSGKNSYTGGTWINGDGGGTYSNYEGRVVIERLSAIPLNDRVYVQGGSYDLSELPVGTVKLAELHLRNAGRVSGFNAALNVQQLFLEHGSFSAPLVGEGMIYKDSDQVVQFGNVPSPGFTGQFVIRDGVVRIDSAALPNANFVMEGGRMEISGEENFANQVVLRGGEVQGGRFTGEILVEDDSTLYANGFTTIYGSLKGSRNLTIRGVLDETYFSRYVGIFGDGSQFSGDIDVQSGALRIGAPGGIGSGTISVMPGARLILASDRETSPPTIVSNTIHLRSGTLISTPPQRAFDGVAPPSIASGDVYVQKEAFIGSTWLGRVDGNLVPGLTLSGRLLLEDNANVFGLSDARNTPFDGAVPLVDVSGELLVGENTVWNLQTSSLAVSGTIRSASLNASIDFVGVESSLDLSRSSFEAQAGQSLAVTINGAAPEIDLQTPAAVIAGNGTLIGSFALSEGATIAPGASAGKLTIDGSATIGQSAIYEWEFTGGDRMPGADWDLLEVEGDLVFESTVENPWILKIVVPRDVVLTQSEPWTIASAHSLQGFDPAAVEFQLFDIAGNARANFPGQFFLTAENGNLMLHAVPEPSTWLMFGMSLACTLRFRGSTYYRVGLLGPK